MFLGLDLVEEVHFNNGFLGNWRHHEGGVEEDLGVVHGAPANQTAVVLKGRELVILDVLVDSFLDIVLIIRLPTH